MGRKNSLMGSSKYEHDPKGLDRDISARAKFFKDCADPLIASMKSQAEITPNICVDILQMRTGDFLLTLDGIDAYIWNNWERLHDDAP